jgi:hypothetical protein
MTPTQAHYEGDTLVLDEWAWDHVAFVPKGAFPNAGVKSTCIGDPRLCDFIPEKPYGFYGAVAAALNPEPRRYNPMQPTIGDLVGKKSSAWQDIKVRGATAFDTADAPDDCFAVVPDAARGPRGNKSLRRLPLVSVEKKQFDADIVRNALTVFKDGAEEILSGTGVAKNDALGKICSAARELGIDHPLCVGMEWSRRVNVPPGRAVTSAFSHFFDPMQATIGDLVGKNIDDSRMQINAGSPPSIRRVNGRLDLSQPTVGDLAARTTIRGHGIRVEPDDFLVHPSRVKEVSR